MSEYLTAQWLANYIRMMRSQDNRTFMIVEGSTDQRFYQQLVDKEKKHCVIVRAENKLNAIETLTILEQTQFKGVLAIVDADFDVLKNVVYSDNLLLTDSHDLETMILKSPALEKFLNEYGSEEKIKKFVAQQGKDIREKLLDEGVHLGYLRWVSLDELDNEHKLKFEGLSFSKFLDKKNLTLNPQKLIKVVKNHSQKQGINEEYLQKKINSKKQKAYNPWYVCCGHDLTAILSEGLRHSFGSRETSEVKLEIAEKNLRLAYEHAYFVSSKLYQSIKRWEEANYPFKVVSS